MGEPIVLGEEEALLEAVEAVEEEEAKPKKKKAKKTKKAKKQKKRTSKYFGVSKIGKRFRAMFGGRYIGMADKEIDAARMVNEACKTAGVEPKNKQVAAGKKSKTVKKVK